ncbi:galactan 5-O-arabinofuranosyltransferase [Candidatus Mycobacterium wuenschmannii]|uniref:Galactan 5-O-arabinofuranosyltransferase n=1 Tax=Candidatus Mycobacterium wuenschmannii TaxID=3027808 RepID=A0ABY8VU43_9MYCO|nr:galactan 5-O-arabinofuranosyltransferase [Candidatus Mycobacterium wuenschmannii]WIM86545.1 galactan 5-O-arabinofuranosyltransferase [Candidatus Mycobacterium wuenschmannii]
MRSALATVGHMVIAVVIAAAVSVISLAAIGRVQWPAFPSSNQLHALTTVGQVGCILGLLCAGWASRRGRRVVARLLALVFVSAFSVVTLGMPLGATKLYLFGISVDQQFRTEYLTRLTDSSTLHDMTYAGLPPFYPPGWFWVGGRVAALTGSTGWETFKPWAITSITIAIAVALVLWARLIRFEYALIVTTATAAVTLAYSSPEPYSAMITVLLPPVFVLAWSGLRGGTRDGGWAAVIGTGAFLGVAATCYTLLPAVSAFTLVLMALAVTAVRWKQGLRQALDPLVRLAAIGGIAATIASITWLPFLLHAARGPVSNSGSAFHYLPADGAELTFPMLKFTLLGALCLLGTLWLVVRARSSVRAGGLAIGVLAIYAWSLLSMLTTLARTTLLSFRLQPTLTVLLTAAGVFGFVEGTKALTTRNRAWLPVAAAIGLAAAIAFAQDIPDVLRPDLTIAYTDTDGHGQRGDRRPPSSEKFYAEIDQAITKATGRPRDETVVLTADYSFLSYYPYYGFQGLTSHYANPLAQFDRRAATIKDWEKLKTADPFVRALDTLPWAPPTVFLLRHGGSAGASSTYTLRLAEDVYPNQPNVRRYTVELNAKIFDDPRFTVTKIGPFVLAVRKP